MAALHFTDLAKRLVERGHDQIKNAPFAFGYLAGISSFALMLVFRRWNFKLSFLINYADLMMDLLKPNLSLMGDDDVEAINKFRKLHTMVPMGVNTAIEKTEAIEIPATDGYKIPCKVYTPFCQHEGKPKPVVVYIHGGGYVVGTPEFYEPATTFIANHTQSIVVGVDYRKAPENKFPCGLNDCVDVVKWVHQHAAELGGDASRIVVMGDSAGGNLTIHVSIELHDLVSFAIPIYPGIFAGFSNTKVRNSSQPILKAATMDWFHQRYLTTHHDLINPRANPLYRSREELSRVPPTHIITAEFDCLLDEGELYYDLLVKNGAKTVTYKQYNDTVHGFFGVQPFTHGLQAVKDVSELINNHFATKP